jgi:hypothetical protein
MRDYLFCAFSTPFFAAFLRRFSMFGRKMYLSELENPEKFSPVLFEHLR